MGLEHLDITEDVAGRFPRLAASQGALVAAVMPGGPAAEAGIGVGDIITEIGGVPVDRGTHDPDERLDSAHSSLIFLDRKRNAVRNQLFRIGTKMNGEIKRAKSQIEEIRALTNQRVALYRQTNTRFRQLLAPPSFRKSPEFPELKWWREVTMTNSDGRPHVG